MIPTNEESKRSLYDMGQIKATILLTIFYFGFIMLLISSIACVYIDEYRLTIIDLGKPKLQKHLKLRFFIWLDAF